MGVQVVILVDLRIFHYFIHIAELSKLQFKVDSSSNLLVLVANGQCIHSERVCEEFKLKVQGKIFQTSFYLLQLDGCNVVLGIQ